MKFTSEKPTFPQVIISLDAASFGDWESAKFAPEEPFLEKLKVSVCVRACVRARAFVGEKAEKQREA